MHLTFVLTLGDDNTNGNWNPTPVRTTIEFRGMQVSFRNLPLYLAQCVTYDIRQHIRSQWVSPLFGGSRPPALALRMDLQQSSM